MKIFQRCFHVANKQGKFQAKILADFSILIVSTLAKKKKKGTRLYGSLLPRWYLLSSVLLIYTFHLEMWR